MLLGELGSGSRRFAEHGRKLVDGTQTGKTLPTSECRRVCFAENSSPAVLSACAHLLDVIFGDYSSNSSCRLTVRLADSLQTLPTHQNGQSLAKPNECDPSVLQTTACAGSR